MKTSSSEVQGRTRELKCFTVKTRTSIWFELKTVMKYLYKLHPSSWQDTSFIQAVTNMKFQFSMRWSHHPKMLHASFKLCSTKFWIPRYMRTAKTHSMHVSPHYSPLCLELPPFVIHLQMNAEKSWTLRVNIRTVWGIKLRAPVTRKFWTQQII